MILLAGRKEIFLYTLYDKDNGFNSFFEKSTGQAVGILYNFFMWYISRRQEFYDEIESIKVLSIDRSDVSVHKRGQACDIVIYPYYLLPFFWIKIYEYLPCRTSLPMFEKHLHFDIYKGVNKRVIGIRHSKTWFDFTDIEDKYFYTSVGNGNTAIRELYGIKNFPENSGLHKYIKDNFSRQVLPWDKTPLSNVNSADQVAIYYKAFADTVREIKDEIVDTASGIGKGLLIVGGIIAGLLIYKFTKRG